MKQNLYHNIAVNLLDASFFGFALGFASFSTIIPLFFATMTDSALIIGLIPAIHNMGWQFPQLFTARKIGQLAYLKPYVLQNTIHERLPFLGFALIAFALPALGIKAGITLALILLIWQGIGSGFAANGWQILISKVIPSSRLTTFFGFQSALFNLCASVAAIASGILLERLGQHFGFTACFLIACVMFTISWFGLYSTREPERKLGDVATNEAPIVTRTVQIIRSNRSFLWYIIARNLSHFGLMASAFYIVYAVKYYGVSKSTAGLLTSVLMASQTLATLFLGWLSDHWSKKWVLIIGMIFTALAPLLAAFVHTDQGFYPIFVLTGISNTVLFLSMAYALNFGNTEEKPLYVGIANTLIAPSTILAPVLGGWLADVYGYPVTFLFAAAAAFLTTLLLIAFVSEPSKNGT
ncbi:MAG: MFS transporter [Anaerolineae bacterium]|nr:MFS transporter [Anaerolineae bacterium]